MQQFNTKNIKAYADCSHITADYMRQNLDKKRNTLVNITAKFLTRCLHAIENYGKRGDRTVLWQIPFDEWLCFDQYGYDDVKKVVYSVLENIKTRGFNVFTIGPGIPLYFVIDWGLTKQKPMETMYDFMQDVKTARTALRQSLSNNETPTHFNNMNDFIQFHNYYVTQRQAEPRLGPTSVHNAKELGLVPTQLANPPPSPCLPHTGGRAPKPPTRTRKKGGSTTATLPKWKLPQTQAPSPTLDPNKPRQFPNSTPMPAVARSFAAPQRPSLKKSGGIVLDL